MADCTGFEWDAGNSGKNWERHGVTQGETEQVFFNRPVRVAPAKFVQGEPRYAALGSSSGGRLLTVVFTLRGTLIRPISARDMSRRERRLYEQKEEE
ncbi:MAG: BrnT family toxin [Vicinamibacteria bacterium]